ncbi:hypothetical protein CHCC14435_4275 [Bacillus licheniformis]|nr:hypothetical protein CHCC14435_4275 [Bacillus licheniformis]
MFYRSRSDKLQDTRNNTKKRTSSNRRGVFMIKGDENIEIAGIYRRTV